MIRFSLVLVPIPELQHAFLPLKCYELGNVPNSFPFVVVTFGFTIESIKELGGASNIVYAKITLFENRVSLEKLKILIPWSIFASPIFKKRKWDHVFITSCKNQNWPIFTKTMRTTQN